MIEFIQHKNLKWYHLLNPSEEDFKYLMDTFPFHPLDIEDCRSKSQRPKVDIYDGYYFMILHFPYFDKINKFLKTKEIKIFWGKDYIITVGNSHWVVKNLFNTAEKNPMLKEELLSGTSDILLYKILERLMSESQILLNKISNEVELINLYLFNKNAEKTIERISITRRNLILLNTIFKPQLRLFHKFESGDVKGFAPDMEEYWSNILDYYQKIWDMIEDYEELIEGLSKTFDSLQANRTNEIMKVLTFISTTLLPLTFLTGLYGMNIGLPLQNSPYSFHILIGIMISIVLFLVLYFRRRKWI